VAYKCHIYMCKSTGLRICNGRFGVDSSKFTFQNKNGCSVIDYLLISSDCVFYIEKTTFRSVFANNSVFNLHFMKVSTENDNNFGYEKITFKKILHLRQELQHMTIVQIFFYLSLKYNSYFHNILWFL
jgi:hypothetical protein